MAKRRINEKEAARKKRTKQERDEELSTSVFNEIEDWDNEEQDYELKPRSLPHTQDVVEGLPIKTADGKIERVVREVDEKKENEQDQEEEQPEEPKQPEEPVEPAPEDAYAGLSPREALAKLKEDIAEYAGKLMEDPEENRSCLTKLRKMTESPNPVAAQLSMMALVPVFKAIAPSYRIRILTETEKREKVSKEVAKLREFEQGLVANYTKYVETLAGMAKVSYTNLQNSRKITAADAKKGGLAVKAACELATALRHFNCRNEVLTIVVRRLNRKPTNSEDLAVFTQCLRVLEGLLQEDEEHGEITHDLVRILCKAVVDKKFRVDESVVNVLLSLSLLRDYDPNKNRDVPKQKIKKKDRVHLTKKERKVRKERKEIEEEMRRAELKITAEKRERHQAEVLRMVLRLYLEILRAGTGARAEAAHLIGAVLEGLARFGDMANLDMLGDFMEVLREIMRDIMDEHALGDAHNVGANEDDDDDDTGGMYDGRQLRTVLLCIATSFTLIMNHQLSGKIPISLDLSRFIGSLYQILADLSLDSDLELSHKTLRLADPESGVVEKPTVNVSTKAELLLRCLDYVFFRLKNGTTPRAAAFTKRLYMALLHTPEKSLLATLKFVGKLVGRHGEAIKGLWNTEERISGEGLYVLGTERLDREVELERCNAGAATLWESVLLDKHYSPMVRDGSRSLMKNSKSGERR